MRRKAIIIGGDPKKKVVKKKPAKKRPSKRAHARTREPEAAPAQVENENDRVRRAAERVQAEERIDTAQLAKAMQKCEHIAAMRSLMVILADMFTDAMEMKSVRSKNIESVGYDEKGRLLRVVFQGGRSYDYTNVSPEIVADLWLASSVGSFIHCKIKPNHPALVRG